MNCKAAPHYAVQTHPEYGIISVDYQRVEDGYLYARRLPSGAVEDLILSSPYVPEVAKFIPIASEGLKYDSEKPRMDLLSPIALNELSKVLTHGASKYAPNNWRKGIATTRLLAAMLRHTFAYLGGESKDPETGLSHISHAMCCAMFILELEVTRPDLDDRYKP